MITPGDPPTRARRVPTVLLAWTAVAILGACGDGGLDVGAPVTTAAPTSAATTTTPAPTSSTTTTAAPVTTGPPTTSSDTTAAPAPPAPEPPPVPTWPPFEPLPGVSGVAALTNLALDDPTAGTPALVVKVDNHPRARPQWDLDAADVVFEVNVEFLTRFIAVFHSRLPGAVGPTRSVRTGDLTLLAALNRPILGWSGGNPYVTRSVAAAHDAGVLVNAGAFQIPRCYSRDRSRAAPHNLRADAACLREAVSTAGPARPLWAFDDGADLSAFPASPELGVRMDGVSVTWRFDPASGRYLRSQDGSPHQAASGVQISATNVVVLLAEHVPSIADERSPEAVTIGSGAGSVSRGGVTIPITWIRASPTDAFTFVDGAGTAVALASGTTFVEIARP